MSEEPTPLQIHARRRRILRNVALVGGGLAALCASQVVCLPTLLDGVWLDECPSGELRQTVDVDVANLRRDAEGWADIRVTAHYTLGRADEDHSAPIRLFRATPYLVTPEGEERELEVRRWDLYGGVLSGHVKLPVVPDGDYTLRFKVRSGLGEEIVDAPLPLYAPAKIHLITDRPLYEPGNAVQFRAVALKARDLTPLAGRPGKWIVTDPTGEVLLEERSPAGEWGVASGSFPLDSGATPGAWTVRYESGADSVTRSFVVEPFTLPRFRVETETSARYYTIGDSPVVRGSVVYSSGAPVGGAALEIDWSSQGAWPPPTSWTERELPRRAVTGSDGTFTLDLPMVPADLQGQATLVGRLRATDGAGDSVTGVVSVLLSADRIQAAAVTELGGGLVEGFNNRLYVRVTTADGQPLPGASVTLKRAWDTADKGQVATADAEGVAAVQIDPGPPVNVVVPALPARPPPRPQAIERIEAYDLLQQQEATLGERLALDQLTPALEGCARWVSGGAAEAAVGLTAAASGAVESVVGGESPLEACVAGALRGARLPDGEPRVLRVRYRVSDPQLPTISIGLSGAPDAPAGLAAALDAAALDARRCLPEDAPDSDLPRPLLWQVSPGSDAVALRWGAARYGERLGAGVVACVEAAFSGIKLDDEAAAGAVGVARLAVAEAQRLKLARPQPTVRLGYELAISAAMGEEELGTTRLVLDPGQVPPLRIRATPVIAQAGQPVTFELLRGPGFSGDLPEELSLQHQDGRVWEGELDAESRKITFTLPEDRDGWYSLSWMDAAARVYVPPRKSLALAVEPAQPRYAPGASAVLKIRTTSGDAGVPAAVGLIGVDESLGQIAALPGPSELADALTAVPTLDPAFGVLDGQALAMGRIQGENAAAAAVLRVTQVPTPEAADREVSARASSRFDPTEALTDRFYAALAELHRQVRAWERSAPAGEQMTPRLQAELWEKAIAACKERGEAVQDAYGRDLRLRYLPDDLLALTDPRQVVLDGARLPEDVEDWTRWVREEEP